MRSRILSGIIYLTVFTSSMAIMFLQLVAGRIIAQYLGQSLLTWTSIIAVTLTGIAIGNHVGGILSDRYNNIKTIPFQFFFASILIASIYITNHLLGNLSLLQNLSWQWRILAHVFLMLLLPFLALGTISPVLTRLLIQVSSSSGTSVGIFFGFSLLGSLAGTFLTGYVFLAHFAYTSLLFLSAFFLFVVAIGYAIGSLYIQSVTSKKIEMEYSEKEEKSIKDVDTQPFYKVLLISFWAGAGVMVLEIVSARLLAKNFGNSLYTWTTIIGVVLGCLSLGGYIGGYLSQHLNPRKVASFFLFLSSLFLLIIPLANVLLPWNPYLWHFSWPVQILIHSIVVFGPACVAFGTISPILIRMISPTNDKDVHGKKIGMIYGVNAFGGILGVIGTGYYAIAHWGTSITIALTAIISALFFLWIAKKTLMSFSYTILVLILFCSALAPSHPWDSLALQTGLKPYRPPNVLYEKESHYNYIQVKLADPERPYILDLVLDKMIHNRKNMKEPNKLTAPYEYIFHSVIDYTQKEKLFNRQLLIGGGAYTFCHFLEQEYPTCQIEVAEIDPEVTKTAFKVFGLPKDTHLKIYHQDGRNRIEDLVREKKHGNMAISYDCIINDSFSDYSVPFHLITREFVEKIYYILSSEGIYLTNAIDCLMYGYFISAMYETYSSVFPYTYMFSTTDNPESRDTFVLVASKKPLPIQTIANQVYERYNTKVYPFSDEKIKALLSKTTPFILTDQFAPVENLLAPTVSFTEETPYLRRLTRIAETITSGGNINQAIDQLLRIINERPNFNNAYIILIDALIQAKRYPEAVAWAKKLIQRLPNEVKVYTLLGTAYARLSNTQSAIEAWEQAIQVDPNLGNVKINLSTYLIQQKQFERAETLIKDVLEKEPTLKFNATMNYAVLRFAQGKFDESLQYLQQAEHLQPNNYSIKEQMAVVYYYSGDTGRAKELIRECQKANHSVNPEFLNLLNTKN
ncbi:MAG TPA: fused MFS/spermidine synthase [Candidatus Hydrogenedens sp.]|nr:fused MFS/spermidine synthase [Candidatus Hydrogenedens sp.]HOL19116.1 fused MFS/spermidine synthase [Candidatus Hydrogenedens sp.]HPP58066.1 fused MFS/spermidine synthase [Candidatus Hydrogenedens sp.]